MLEELEIHNLGPIRSALIAPAGGMTAITGETGAGKSMLLSAIRLISGGPSDGGRVSVGAQEAWAQGVFEVGLVAGRGAEATGSRTRSRRMASCFCRVSARFRAIPQHAVGT